MLSKAVSSLQKSTLMRQAVGMNLIKTPMRMFSHGPYNPLHYKNHSVPEELPTYESLYLNNECL